MKQIVIDNKVLFYDYLNVSTTFGSSTIIYLEFDLVKYPNYKETLFKLYDFRRNKFDISTNKFTCTDNVIFSMDYDKYKLSLQIKVGILTVKNINEIRDNIISDILNNDDDGN